MDDQHRSVPSEGIIGRAMIDSWGGGALEIVTSRGSVLFKWSERFGPMPVTKTGAEQWLSHRHSFWREVSLWNIQGRRTEGGRAVWREPKKPVLEHLGGRHYRVIEDGEPGYDW